MLVWSFSQSKDDGGTHRCSRVSCYFSSFLCLSETEPGRRHGGSVGHICETPKFARIDPIRASVTNFGTLNFLTLTAT